MTKIQSFANMHWPGLYSIVVTGTEPGRLKRLYVAKPGELHPDLQDAKAPFLHHKHAYDFRSTTVLGTVENDVYEKVHGWGSGEKFHEYSFGSAMNGEPTLKWVYTVRLQWLTTDVCRKGERYSMESHEIHRVVFHPCPRTGWFAVCIQEMRARPRSTTCWAREYLDDIPYKSKLYKPITNEQARGILDELRDAGGDW